MEEDSDLKEVSNNLNPLKRHKVLAITLAVVITLLGAFALTLAIYTRDRGTIANGVVLEVPLGNLSIEEAGSKLEERRKEIVTRSIHFATEGKIISISMEELGLTYTYDAALRQAYLIGREGNVFEKALGKFKASWGITFEPEYQWNNRLLAEALKKLLSHLDIPAENAHLTIADDALEIVAEKLGKQVDIDSLISSVSQLTLDKAETLPIPFKTISPTILQAELESLKSANRLSTYTTNFDPTQKGRTQNIVLAAKAIDCLVLKPGEEFSFNQTVGPRTAEAGYQAATIIEGNNFVPGLGGGVCQVSSTLYNAVRLASLNVTERSHHSLAVTYVPPGQDATVAYPILDFKFKNDSGSYLLIRSVIRNNTLNLSIYGG